MKRVGLIFILLSFIYAQEELLELGKRYADEGKYNLAKEIFTSLYERHKDKDVGKRALFERSLLSLAMSDTASAVEDLSHLEKEALSESLAYMVASTFSKIEKNFEKKGEHLLRFALQFPLAERAEEAFKSAALFFEKAKKYERAILVYKKLGEIFPDKRVEYQISIGRIWLYLGKFERSKRLLERYSDSLENARLYLAYKYLLGGDTTNAIFLLSSIDNFHAKLLLSDIYIALGNLEKAKEALSDAAIFAPQSSEVYSRKLKFFLLEGNLEEAKALVPLVKDILLISEFYLRSNLPESVLIYLKDKTDVKSKYLKAMAYLMEGKIFPAYEEAIILPDSLIFNDIKIEIGKLLEKKGLYIESLDILEKVRNWYPKEEVLNILYSLYILRGDSLRADSIKEILISRGIKPRSPYSSSDLIEIFMKYSGKRYSIAKALYDLEAYHEIINLFQEKGLKVEEAKILASAYTALYLSTKDTLYAQKAERIYRVLKDKPSDYYVLHSYWHPEKADLRGIALTDFKDEDKVRLAILFSKRGMKKRAFFVTNYISDSQLRNRALFYLYLYRGKLDSSYIYLNEDWLDDVYLLAEAYSKLDEDNIALALLDYIPIEGFSLDEKAQFLKIKLLYRDGKYEEFKKECSLYFKIFASSPRVDSLKKIMAYAFYNIGIPEKTYQYLLPFKDDEALKLKTLSLLEMGRIDEAEKIGYQDDEVLWKMFLKKGDYKKLLEFPYPDERKDLLSLLELMLNVSSIDTFRLVIDNLLEKKIIADDEAQIWLIRSLLKEGRLDEAVEIFKFQGLNKKPEAAYHIGLSYFKKGDFEKAKNFFLEGIKSENKDVRGNSSFKLATIFARVGKYKEALLYYDKAFNLLKDPEIQKMAIYNKAISFKKLDMIDSAISQYRYILEFYPDEEEAVEAQISLAFLLLDTGKAEEALALLEDLAGEMKRIRDEAERIYWKGEALVVLNRPHEALNSYLILYKNYSNVDNWGVTAALKAGKLLAFLGDSKSAKQIYNDILKKRGLNDPFGKIARDEIEKLP